MEKTHGLSEKKMKLVKLLAATAKAQEKLSRNRKTLDTYRRN